MKKINTIEQIDWYPKVKDKQIYKEIILRDLFPKKFSGYCKILNPFYISSNYAKMKNKKWKMDFAKWLFNGDKEWDKEWDDAIENYIPTNYKKICNLLKIGYSSNISSDIISQKNRNEQYKWLLFPDEGTIARK